MFRPFVYKRPGGSCAKQLQHRANQGVRGGRANQIREIPSISPGYQAVLLSVVGATYAVFARVRRYYSILVCIVKRL